MAASGYPQRRTQTARGVCGACKEPIEWVTLSSGSRAPVDVHPDPIDGEVYVLGTGASWRVGFAIRDAGLRAEALGLGHRLHRFHADTCARRRPRERRDLA